ncbi:hypothetical protein BT63DRAFT_477386 [Microthyrium microscopicum]|uniref:Protein kinase domain-containing protein n=1 Tax=Microthyrium microscopicum TaxID=703497 RepID=A0A6A6UI94_9PEZI|nr:hypothetical protein BT63DRAFT_477386 [Microthyrium microscopicum]
MFASTNTIQWFPAAGPTPVLPSVKASNLRWKLRNHKGFPYQFTQSTPLGEGGFGVAYEVFDVDNTPFVAKFVPVSKKSQVISEIHVLAMLKEAFKDYPAT